MPQIARLMKNSTLHQSHRLTSAWCLVRPQPKRIYTPYREYRRRVRRSFEAFGGISGMMWFNPLPSTCIENLGLALYIENLGGNHTPLDLNFREVPPQGKI